MSYNIDESLFPVNLRSNEWHVLPWSLSSYLSHIYDSSIYYYPISLFRSPHCFVFWLFLPRPGWFKIEIMNLSVEGVVIWRNGNKEYSYGKGKRISIGDRWTISVKNQPARDVSRQGEQKYYYSTKRSIVLQK